MNNKAQASLELALFGSLILMAVVTLFSYAEKLNDQQYVEMKAFRSALLKANQASDLGGTASYTILEHRRYTAGDFFGQGSRSAVSSGGQVLWGKLPIDAIDKPNDSGQGTHKEAELGDFAEANFYRINDDEFPITFPSEDNPALIDRYTTLLNDAQAALDAVNNGGTVPDAVQKALDAYEHGKNIAPSDSLATRLENFIDDIQKAIDTLGANNGEKPEGDVSSALGDYEKALGIKRSIEVKNSSTENSTQTAHKAEDTSDISTTHTLNMTDTVNTTVEETTKNADGSSTAIPFIQTTQGLYQDAAGKYRYNKDHAGSVVIRSQTWVTPH